MAMDIAQRIRNATECWVYKKNANAGDVEVQTLLGTIYYNGQCVDQDYVKASKWFEKAANQGKVFAQMSLGMIYARGDGVK